MSNIRIINGHIIDPSTNLNGHGSIEITSGNISFIECSNKIYGDKSVSDLETIDAQGSYVFPGFIDVHVHFRDPGYTYKESIETGSRAAAEGGYTTVCAMPNTNPATDNINVVQNILSKSNDVGLCRVLPVGAISKNREGKQLAGYDGLVKAGVRLFSDDGSDTADTNVLYNAMLYLKDYPDARTVIHAEDSSMSKSGAITEGTVSREYGFSAQSPLSEILGTNRAMLIAEYLNTPVHIAHVSLRQVVDAIRNAKANGQKVSCEVTLHHLLLTERELIKHQSLAKLNPPLRSEEDRLELLSAYAEGVIDCLVTDHAPHSVDEKLLPLEIAPAGMIGLEVCAALTYDKLVRSGLVSLERWLESLTLCPAIFLSDTYHGSLEVGYAGDVVIFNPDLSWEIQQDQLASKCKITLYHGWNVTGRVTHTIHDGKIVYTLQGSNE